MMKQQSIRKAPWEKIILYALASIWAVICLFPIWHLISATFSTDASNITTTFFPNSISNYFIYSGQLIISFSRI